VKLFGVDYAFQSCGSVFTDGLAHAAARLGLTYQHADSLAPDLVAQVDACRPDLIFVVHGRIAAQRLPVQPWRSAVWLLDEPYEVDETARWSGRFDQVFVSDPSTLDRHPGAVYLPAAYNPAIHYGQPWTAPRLHAVGFIGGANPRRDAILSALASSGWLSYVVGGPFRDPYVQARTVAQSAPPRVTAQYYRDTDVVINIWRDQHQWNRDARPGVALNPRVYEALACGAMVISEWRPELDLLCPDVPTFRTPGECIDAVADWFAQPLDWRQAVQARAAADLADATYAARLQTVCRTMGLAAAA
jgi:hypothetical protein